VLLVSAATVGLWCANGALADVFGEMGVIAVLPMVAFFGFGVLGKARASARPAPSPLRGTSGVAAAARVQLCICLQLCAGHLCDPVLRLATCALHMHNMGLQWQAATSALHAPRPSGPVTSQVVRLRLAMALRPGVTLGRRAALPESSGAQNASELPYTLNLPQTHPIPCWGRTP